MAMAPVDFGDALPIDGYGPGFFRIGGEVWRGGVLIHADAVSGWGGLRDEAALAALKGKADLLLVGTGAEIAILPESFQDAADAAGMRIEFMSSPAAARSYNVLLAQGRLVAAALIPV